MKDCIFCQIARRMAFLSIFPNTKGFSVVITKEHYPSYAFALSNAVLQELIIATKNVARLLDAKLDDVGRTGMIFEGFGVDHVHAKLFPMHGTANLQKWKPIESKMEKYFEQYEGYISSHDAKRADDNSLTILAKEIKGK